MQENRFVLTLQPRQCGKTLTAAMYLLWYAMFTDDVLVLIASKNQKHALEIAERIRFAYQELPSWIKCGLKYYNRHNIEFDNGSRIISEATTENTGRGLAISKLYLDELAFINPRIQEDLWGSLAPTLSTGGSAIISSTPNGDTELFAQLWRRANSGIEDALGTNFIPFEVNWREHPERGDEYWDTMVNLLGLLQTRQEVGCVGGTTMITTRNKLSGKIQHDTIEDVAKELLAHAQDTLQNNLDSSERQNTKGRFRKIVRDSSHQWESRGRSSGEPRVHPSTAALRAALGAWRSIRGDVDRQKTWEDASRAKRDSARLQEITGNLQEDLGDQTSTVRGWIETIVQGQEAQHRDEASVERKSSWEATLIKALAGTGPRDPIDSRTTPRSSGISAPEFVRVGAGKAPTSNEVPIVLNSEPLQSSEGSELVLLIPNTILEILTPSGFQEFSGIRVLRKSGTLKIHTALNTISCSLDHRFKDAIASKLKIGDPIPSMFSEEVLAIEEQGASLVYDPVDVGDGHLYITNGFISHNCEFLSSEALLINSMVLHKLAGKIVHHTDMGFKFWVPPEQLGGPGKTYLVSIDPATGNGKDFSVIEVFDFPALNQVAEWRSNEINIPLLYAKVKWILTKLSEQKGRGRAEILWTFERNGIGEAMCALFVNDEKQPEFAELYNDTPGQYGVYTSGKTKILSCLQLKALIEKVKGGMQINSETLLFELKNFIAKGGTYTGKTGTTDDCVSATIGITRLIKRLAEYNDEAFKQVNEYVDPTSEADELGGEPMPFLM